MSHLMRLSVGSLPSPSRWRTKTKEVSQRVEVGATPPSLVGSVSVKTSPEVTPSEDHVSSFDAEQVDDIDENIELFAGIGTKIKP